MSKAVTNLLDTHPHLLDLPDVELGKVVREVLHRERLIRLQLELEQRELDRILDVACARWELRNSEVRNG